MSPSPLISKDPLIPVNSGGFSNVLRVPGKKSLSSKVDVLDAPESMMKSILSSDSSSSCCIPAGILTLVAPCRPTSLMQISPHGSLILGDTLGGPHGPFLLDDTFGHPKPSKSNSGTCATACFFNIIDKNATKRSLLTQCLTAPLTGLKDGSGGSRLWGRTY